MTIETAEILWVLNLLTPKELSNAAIKWLAEGFNSKSLPLLAGLDSEDFGEASMIFELTMSELGRPILTKKEALLSYTRLISDEILLGNLSPYEGAKKIWHASINLNEPVHEVDAFVYAASEFEDRFEDQDFFTSEILKEARRWIIN